MRKSRDLETRRRLSYDAFVQTRFAWACMLVCAGALACSSEEPCVGLHGGGLAVD